MWCLACLPGRFLWQRQVRVHILFAFSPCLLSTYSVMPLLMPQPSRGCRPTDKELQCRVFRAMTSSTHGALGAQRGGVMTHLAIRGNWVASLRENTGSALKDGVCLRKSKRKWGRQAMHNSVIHKFIRSFREDIHISCQHHLLGVMNSNELQSVYYSLWEKLLPFMFGSKPASHFTGFLSVTESWNLVRSSVPHRSSRFLVL